jgi:hypothetical protein
LLEVEVDDPEVPEPDDPELDELDEPELDGSGVLPPPPQPKPTNVRIRTKQIAPLKGERRRRSNRNGGKQMVPKRIFGPGQAEDEVDALVVTITDTVAVAAAEKLSEEG